jgi:hypothetical protein
MDSTTPLAVPNAQNTAQRSQKISDGIMDDHKEVSSQDYSPELPTGKQLTDATASVPPITASKGQIESMGAQDVQTVSGVEERRARMERADAEKSLKSRLIEKYGFSGDNAAKLSTKLYDNYKTQQELKINQLSANLEMQNKSLRAQSAHAQAQEKLAGIDLTAEDAPQQIAGVLREAAPHVSGTPYFDEIMKIGETHYSHANQFGKSARQQQQLLDTEKAKASQEARRQKYVEDEANRADTIARIRSAETPEELEEAYKHPNTAQALAGRYSGSIASVYKEQQKKFGMEASIEQVKLHPDLYEMAPNAQGIMVPRRKKVSTSIDFNKMIEEKKKGMGTTPSISPSASPRPLVAPAPTSIGATPEEESYNDGSSSLPPDQSQDTTGQPSGSQPSPQFTEGQKVRQGGVVYEYRNGSFNPVQ